MPPFPSVGTDQQHVQTIWYQFSIKDRATLLNKLFSVPPATRRDFNDILYRLRREDLDILREWFIRCHPHHFQVAIEICTKLKRDHKKSDARAGIVRLALPQISIIVAERFKPLLSVVARCWFFQLVAGALDDVHLPVLRSCSAAKSARDQLEGAPWLELQQRLGDLPLELRDMIRDTLFEQEFGPGRMNMPAGTSSDIPPNVRLFLAMNKKMYTKYHDMLWSSNTWILGPAKGEPPDNFRFQIASTTFYKIRQVELALSLSDLSTAPIDKWFQKNKITTSGSACDYIEVLQRFRNSYVRLNQVLQEIWESKIEVVEFFHLTHLTINLTDTYGIDGEYLGSKQVEPLTFLYRWFKIRSPKLKFATRAPTKELEVWIHDAVISYYS